MRYLSLFSGVGGGDLAAQHLLGWTCVGYVEWDDYCQKILRRRQEDGALNRAPIFGDVRSFIDQGYASSYTGMVDVICAGFPCQPFSAAGKMLGADDTRNMWPATVASISAIRPKYCLLENVRSLSNSRYFGRILGDLAACGYDARWRILSAAELGAPHKRDRLWIVAVDNTNSIGSQKERSDHEKHDRVISAAATQHAREMADTNDATEQAEERKRILPKERHNAGRITWWLTEPGMGRVVDGVANRVDRLKAIGNGQVPAVAATAWYLLSCADKHD